MIILAHNDFYRPFKSGRLRNLGENSYIPRGLTLARVT